MKNTIILFTLLLFATACGKEEQIERKNQSIVGVWTLTAQIFGNVGDPGSWEAVTHGGTMEFDTNFKYNDSGSPMCASNPSNIGTYALTTDKEGNFVSIKFPCDQWEGGIFELKYMYTFQNEYLILGPTFSCDEGCSFKYERVTPEVGD